VWFHVDGLSSAHVYLRQRPDESKVLDDIPPDLVNECAQLVKDNSIAGCKLASCPVVYTRWKNLKKTASMDVGQIGYHDTKKQRRLRVEKDREVIKAINKTKTEAHPDLAALQAARAAEEVAARKAAARKQAALDKEQKKAHAAQAELRSYKTLFDEAGAAGLSNKGVAASEDQSAAEDFEDDFM